VCEWTDSWSFNVEVHVDYLGESRVTLISSTFSPLCLCSHAYYCTVKPPYRLPYVITHEDKEIFFFFLSILPLAFIPCKQLNQRGTVGTGDRKLLVRICPSSGNMMILRPWPTGSIIHHTLRRLICSMIIAVYSCFKNRGLDKWKKILTLLEVLSSLETPISLFKLCTTATPRWLTHLMYRTCSSHRDDAMGHWPSVCWGHWCWVRVLYIPISSLLFCS
jgi:hypothetical protein